MQYFKPGFIKFFKDLSKNNSSAWFNENRKVYETEVKKPFVDFVQDLINNVGKKDRNVRIKPADAITRINKDIRFSKDKTPYNTHVGAIISPYGKKSKEYPGLYVQLGADKITLFGGAYMPEKENLTNIRKHLVKNPASINKVIDAPSFKKKFGSIEGDKNKVLPPEFKSVVEKQPLIANKSFHFTTTLDPKIITTDKLMDTVLEYYEAAKPMNDYLVNAMGM